MCELVAYFICQSFGAGKVAFSSLLPATAGNNDDLRSETETKQLSCWQ